MMKENNEMPRTKHLLPLIVAVLLVAPMALAGDAPKDDAIGLAAGFACEVRPAA